MSRSIHIVVKRGAPRAANSLATKADLVTFRDMLVTSHDRIKKLFDEGKTEDEVIALKPLADLDATWGNNPQHAIGHTRNVYNSFKRL